MYNAAPKKTTADYGEHQHQLEKLLTVQQTADLLSTGTVTVLRMIRRKALDASKIGGEWRIKPSSLKRLIDKAEEVAR